MTTSAEPALESDATRRPRGSTRALVALLAFVLGFATVPHRVCERDAARWFAGDPARTATLGGGIAHWIEHDVVASSFATGSSRFDEEWLFATYAMSALGFGQLASAEREGGDGGTSVARMETCLDALLDPRLRALDAKTWGADALASTAAAGTPDDSGHAAYLGYAALALALHRQLRPESRFVATEETVVAALARRITRSKAGFLETYPGEVYPVDNTAAFAALALHARALRGRPPEREEERAATEAALARGLEAMRARGIDAATGLLFQAVTVDDAAPVDSPRASGTALAAYFLSFADPAMSRGLFRALKAQFRTVLGFGGMLEYPPGTRKRGDIDSGPVLLGFGVSASGFALGASRIYGDRDTFRALYASAHLFGAPLDESDGTRTYVVGGPLGDAILFAMFTALPIGRFA